jgi:multiple sugar transport system substrate-binding protein
LRRILSAFVTVCMFLSVLAGCSSNSTNGTPNSSNANQGGGSDSGKKEKPKITFWMKKQFVPDQNKLIEERVKQFEKEFNVDVNFELIAYEDAFPKWTAAIESGNVPDVSFLGYQETGQFYEKGVMMDVSDFVKELEKKNGSMYDSLKNSVTFQGKTFAVPFWAETQILYYRKDLLSKAGYDHPPKTWEEFREIAKATTDPAKAVYGAGIGFGKANSDAEWLTRSMIWAYGGSLVDKDGKTVVANNSNNIQAANYIKGIFLDDKSTPPSSVGWDDSGNNKAYLSGQAAMISNTGSVLNTLKKDLPEIYKNTGVAPLPAGPKGAFIPGITMNLGIFKGSKNPEMAKKLIEYLTDKEWYKKWIDVGAPLALPIYTSLEKEDVWKDPYNKPFLDSVKDFKFLGYPGEYTPKAGEIYNLRYLNDAFQRILVEKYTPEKALEELQKKMEEVYKK